MKISIIKSDKAVYKNNVAYLDLELTTIPQNVRALQFNDETGFGHIEFDDIDGQSLMPNETIQSLPSWAIDCLQAWDVAYDLQHNPPSPSPEELLQICKDEAKKHLQETDWSEIPSVVDSNNTPHLLNADAFVQYRNTIRNYVVNPVINPTWPTQPTAEWS